MNTPYGKDVLRMLADECHCQDMKLHLYYSHLDWTREDYPIGRTGRGTGREGRANWPEYYAFMNRQLKFVGFSSTLTSTSRVLACVQAS